SLSRYVCGTGFPAGHDGLESPSYISEIAS
ncbi:unnamed protein product, partial [marine sediment metagenome]